MSAEELARLRVDFPRGRFVPKIEMSTFKLGDYQRFLDAEADSIEAFRHKQQKAFAEERERWEKAGLNVITPQESVVDNAEETELLDGESFVQSAVAGNLWRLDVEEGQSVDHGQVVAILEAMKMEIHVSSHVGGRVKKLLVKEGQTVTPGQNLMVIEAT